MKHHIFLSYRRADREIAQALVTALEAKGMDVWWDDEIEGGVDWRDSIVENLMNSDMVVILFSEECNTSKQLKKELAIADQMDKNVVPVLIEDTTPKGHYLYELASRNWIQIHPEAMTKIDRLVEKLITIAGNAPRELERKPNSAEAVQESNHATPPIVDQRTMTPPVAPELVQGVASPLVPPLSIIAPPIPAEQGAKTSLDQKKPPKEEKMKNLRELLPFQRFDLIPLSVFGLLCLALPWIDPFVRDFAMMFLTLLIPFYGAVVFPVRYYRQHLSPLRVARMLFLSILIMFIPFASFFIFLIGYHSGGRTTFLDVSFWFAFFFIIILGVSLLIYAIASGQRALRNFRSNVEKL